VLFDMCTNIYESIENKEKVNMHLYDFSNAYGCLVPEILVQNKLKRYGFQEEALTWIETFLIRRTQDTPNAYSPDETEGETSCNAE
jgi:hypothetical protein